MGGLTYTPDAGYTGTDTFTYALRDGQTVSNPATVTITIGGTGKAQRRQLDFLQPNSPLVKEPDSIEAPNIDL